VEDVIRGSGWCKKGAANETGHPISKPVALQKELQTKSCHSNPTGTQGRTGRASCLSRSSDQYI
jgi:hypothetical protein